ncbi:cytochrome P450 [Tanacetum coccineum]
MGIQETMSRDDDPILLSSLWKNTPYFLRKADGKSEGILAMWDTSYFSATSTMDDDEFVDVLAKWLEIDTNCLMIVVYAPQDNNKKKSLWQELNNLINHFDILSIMIGDFNEVRTASEFMGSIFDSNEALNFNNFISEADLFDIPLGGKHFISMDNIGSKLIKIDRFLVSNHYFDSWPNSYALALPSIVLKSAPRL